MSEKNIVLKELKLKWSGIFNLGDLYRKMKWWLDYNGYRDETKNFKELRYTEKVKPEGKQIEIAWECKKPITDYFVNVIEVTFFITGLQKTEVMREGKKITMDKGDIEMKFSAYLLENASDKWLDKSFVNKVYKKYLVRDRIEEYKIDLYRKLYSFHNEVKINLDIHKF
ncbi:MAG: hypothetical protein AB1571_00330 [Nanoarchaeota archaeon]